MAVGSREFFFFGIGLGRAFPVLVLPSPAAEFQALCPRVGGHCGKQALLGVIW